MKIAIIILLAFFTISCEQNHMSIVKSYEELHNAHDIERTMLLYHDDIKFELIGTWVKSGKSEIRALEEWDKALNSSLKFEAIDSRGDSVFCKVIEKNDWFKAVGIEQIIHDPTIFIIHKGLIKNIIVNPTAEIGKEIGIKLGSIYSWSKITNDSTIHDLIIDGEFIYSVESAKKWLILLDNWNKHNTAKKVE